MAAFTPAEADSKAAAIPSPMAENILPSCSAIAWQQLVVAGQRRSHGRLIRLPQPSRALDISEQESNGARRAAITPQHPTSANPAARKPPQGSAKTVPTAQVRHQSHPSTPRRTGRSVFGGCVLLGVLPSGAGGRP